VVYGMLSHLSIKCKQDPFFKIVTRTHAYTTPKTMNEDNNKPVEVEVRNWDGHSFTVEGENHQLEKLLKEQKIIRALALRHNGRMVRIGRDVRLKSRKDCYFTPELETTTIKNPLYQGTTFEYEDLDNSL
jgi:argininosuccinate synthase